MDTSIASVPIEDVVFDTFRGGFIKLSKADDETIELLRDRIKPIYEPKYDSVEGGDWLDEDDLVLGYVSQRGVAFAYPHKILDLHEIVNDVIDGVPVLASYCPLCASGVVYSRELDGGVLLFGNTSALYESDLVMYDHQTGSYWFQVIGEAIVGPLTGKRLRPLPSVTTTWTQWKELHPDTKILSKNLGLTDPLFYQRDRFKGYDKDVNRERFVFPVSKDKLDDRLRPGDRVFAIQVGESHKAYLLTGRPDEVINDEVAGEEVVIIVRAEGPTGSAYLRAANGQILTFTLNQGVLQDNETGSRWDDGGRAISGPLAGSLLTPVPSRASFLASSSISRGAYALVRRLIRKAPARKRPRPRTPARAPTRPVRRVSPTLGSTTTVVSSDCEAIVMGSPRLPSPAFPVPCGPSRRNRTCPAA